MKESIVLYATATNHAQLDDLKRDLQTVLDNEGSAAVVQIAPNPIAPYETGFRIDYNASYRFATPDNRTVFGDTVSLTATGDAGDLVLMRILQQRDAWVARSYRNAVRGIAVLAGKLDSGNDAPPPGVSQAKYLSDTLALALAEFPNSN